MFAETPEDLPHLFLERANAGDLDGLVDLYEADAVVAFPNGQRAVGHAEIRRVYGELLRVQPRFLAGVARPTLLVGDLALTSNVRPTATAAEVARRQPDGSWRWVVDDPAIA
ncbi:MAG: YybH family protein [Candidatus Dormibacteraceae bacterium]